MCVFSKIWPKTQLIYTFLWKLDKTQHFMWKKLYSNYFWAAYYAKMVQKPPKTLKKRVFSLGQYDHVIIWHISSHINKLQCIWESTQKKLGPYLIWIIFKLSLKKGHFFNSPTFYYKTAVSVKYPLLKKGPAAHLPRTQSSWPRFSYHIRCPLTISAEKVSVSDDVIIMSISPVL